MNRFFELADRPEGSVPRAKRNPPPGVRWVAEKTGVFRTPKAGEWFLSGAIPEGYRAASDNIKTAYYILRLVQVRREVRDVRVDV